MSKEKRAGPNTFIEPDIGAKKILDQLMRNGSSADVFNDDFHLRVVGKTSILLLEPKVCGVEMNDKRGRAFGVLLKDVGSSFHYNGPNDRVC